MSLKGLGFRAFVLKLDVLWWVFCGWGFGRSLLPRALGV